MKDRILLLLSLTLVLTTTLPAQSPAQPVTPDFQANAEEVLVDAVVTDKKGNTPRDLTANDFKILEDGKEQKITSFSSTANRKHFVALVFDYDEPAFREEAIRFVDRFHSPDLYIAIYARINEEIHLVQAFTTEPLRLRTALRDMRIVGETQGVRYTRGAAPEMPMLDRIDKVAAELKPVHGRKAPVLFTGEHLAVSWAGGAGPTDRQLLRTIDNCNKANVAIYGFNIDASVTSAADWYRGRGGGKTTNRIRDLAERTGGKYGTPGSNQLAGYLGAIAAQSDDYLLGYTPSADSASNCHKLEVTVARKDLAIDARDTYCTSVPNISTASAALTAMQATWFYLKRGTALVNIAMQSNGKSGIVLRPDGSVAARFSGNIVKLPPGSYRIRVSNAEQSINIPLWNGETIFASDIALGDREIPSESVTINLDPALFDGPYRLASGEREFIPMATTQFHLKQQGLLYFEIYDPGPRPPTMELTIIDREKGEQKFNSGPIDTTPWISPGSTRIPITMPFPTANLPAGNYTLELRVNHEDGKDEIVRTTDFEVK